jgi:hypothetical protein
VDQSHASPNASSAGGVVAPVVGTSGAPLPQPSPPAAAARGSGWASGSIAAVVIGALVALVGLGLLGTGGTLLWADRTHRDGGFLTTDRQHFSSAGSALVTVPAQLGSWGTGWVYAPALLDTVRIRVWPAGAGSALFVGVARTADVDDYLAGMSHTLITEYFQATVRPVSGGPAPGAPAAQPFWVASASGPGPQTVEWRPTDGTWTVVVMNADGTPGVDVVAELGAAAPAVPWIALGLLIGAAVFLVAGFLLVVGAIRRRRASPVDAASATLHPFFTPAPARDRAERKEDYANY